MKVENTVINLPARRRCKRAVYGHPELLDLPRARSVPQGELLHNRIQETAIAGPRRLTATRHISFVPCADKLVSVVHLEELNFKGRIRLSEGIKDAMHSHPPPRRLRRGRQNSGSGAF